MDKLIITVAGDSRAHVFARENSSCTAFFRVDLLLEFPGETKILPFDG